MKLVRGTVILLAAVFVVVAFGLYKLFEASRPDPKPAWVDYYYAADNARSNGEEYDRQAQLMLQEGDKYGGRMPPQEPMEPEMKMMESIFWWFPMQDRGYTMSYAEGLRNIALPYKNSKQYDQALPFYRKAMELELAEQKENPKKARRANRSEVCDILMKLGRKQEAVDLQKEEVAETESHANDPGNRGYTTYQAGLLADKAKAFEMEGKYDDAEACWKKAVDQFKDDLLPERIAQLKDENVKMTEPGRGLAMPNIIRWYELTAEYYDRRKDFPKQEQTLLKRLDVLKSVSPENSPKLAQYYEELATFYEHYQQHAKAADAIRHMIKCEEKPRSWEWLSWVLAKENKHEEAVKAMDKAISLYEADPKEKSDMGSYYIRYSKVLKAAGKEAEATKYRDKAHAINPSIGDSSACFP